ncbi:MAG TPA: hypothetical protein VIQ55_00495, partial [Burkholderiales bacterium]
MKPAQASAVKPDVTSLRSTLDWLRKEGLLIETEREVDPDLEITGLQKHFDGSLPMLFNKVKGKPHARAITNLFSDISLINRMFGWASSQERTRQLAQALSRPLKPRIIEEGAPCQEFVVTKDIDVNQWITAIRHTALEPELTIG